MAAPDAHDNTKILGIAFWARHGDRQGFYQDPLTYTPSATSITPLGEVRTSCLVLQICAYIFATE